MSMKTVLIVETDPGMQRFLRRVLSKHCKVLVGEAGRLIDEEVVDRQPDVVILDDPERCTEIRQRWPSILVMVISAEAGDKQIVHALDLGADDYMVKPLSAEEFGARVRALLRRVLDSGSRSVAQEPESLESKDGYLRLNKTDQQAYVGGQRVSFTPTEFALVWQLLLHTEKVLSHQTLLKAVWVYSDNKPRY
jgi:two-component system KDP operon response regulator KdpE